METKQKKGKAMRSFTIDLSLIEKLRNEENQSGLVNRLLNDYFNYVDSEDLDYLNAKKQEKIEMVEIANKEIEHITNKMIVVQARHSKEEIAEKYKARMEELTEQTATLQKQWREEEITDEEFYKACEPIQKEKDEIRSKIRRGL
jgi:galactokinase